MHFDANCKDFKSRPKCCLKGLPWQWIFRQVWVAKRKRNTKTWALFGNFESRGWLWPIKHSICTDWLFDWLVGQPEGKTWNVYLAALCVALLSSPTISILVANLGPNWNLLNYCAVPMLRLFPFIISVISWAWIFHEWAKQVRNSKKSKAEFYFHFVNWPFTF